MSVGRILTLGFGSFGGVRYLPTLGYGTSAVVVVIGEPTKGWMIARRGTEWVIAKKTPTWLTPKRDTDLS